MTLMDTCSATSSQGSVDGVRHSDWQDGQQTDLFGLGAAPANPSAAQDDRRDLMMSDTCGQPSADSLTSASLQQSLASRLVERLELTGSPLYALTWKPVDMPSGPPICRLRALAHR